MSNTVITNYTDLNGPCTKADSSIVVIVNKDGSLSVDKKHLSTLMSNDRSQGAGISVVRIGHDGPPEDATDSENEEDIPHVTLSVDSYYDDPSTVIKYDSGADMFHSLRIETRENSLIGFQNDHCYIAQPALGLTATKSAAYSGFNEPILEIKAPQPNQDVPSSKKITILEQKIIPQGRKISINPKESVVLKGNDIINKPLAESKHKTKHQPRDQPSDENEETTSVSSSGESVADRDSDSDYKGKEKLNLIKKSKLKPRILKNTPIKTPGRPKLDTRAKILKPSKNVTRKENKERSLLKSTPEIRKIIKSTPATLATPTTPVTPIAEHAQVSNEMKKETPKPTPKLIKKEKKTPSHVTALLSDMTTLFSTPDVIRRVSSDSKMPTSIRKSTDTKPMEQMDKSPIIERPKTSNLKIYTRLVHKAKPEKDPKSIEPMPQIDDVSLAQILQDPPAILTTPKAQAAAFPPATTAGGTASAGPLSPTLDLLGVLQPEEEGLTEDLLMHVAQLVESSENLQEVIDKQVLETVEDPIAPKQAVSTPSGSFVETQALKAATTQKTVAPQKNPIEIVRRDGRVITLPPIEAPATRASKRKSAIVTNPDADVSPSPPAAPTQEPAPIASTSNTPAPPSPAVLQEPARQYVNKKLLQSQERTIVPVAPPVEQTSELPLETDSLNSEDDPNRLWCICKQPHNNRFMICCDRCEDWFHGKCVNITKSMGQQMEEQGVEWTCPNCCKKTSPAVKQPKSKSLIQKKIVPSQLQGSVNTKQYTVGPKNGSSKHICIVCKKAARASSIYCSDACIIKHAHDSLEPPATAKIDSEPGKVVDKKKLESRVIVFERKTGRCLAGPNAPTAENLKAWLQKNPTFEVVRPGTLSALKPGVPTKKPSTPEPRKIQTTLNFDKVPKKSLLLNQASKTEKEIKSLIKEEIKIPSKMAMTPKHTSEQPRPSTSSASPKAVEAKKSTKPTLNRSWSSTEKAPPSPATPKKKDNVEKKSKPSSIGSIRDNVRKALTEQLTLRLKESKDVKITPEEVKQFADDTEGELHELFNQDVGVKYKAKYRSLMFNIKDRKNLSLWQKICDKSITAKQLVRLSPEELASQELAEWRDNEAKHQLELIKKSELDLLAASKTYVLKTHKGEEVIKPKTAVETELDPNMPVEDVVTALNDPSVMDETAPADSEQGGESKKPSGDSARSSSSKKKRKDGSKSRSKESKSETHSRSSRSTRRSSPVKEKEERSTRRSERRTRSTSRDRRKSKTDSKRKSRDSSKPKTKSKSKQKSKSRSRSRTRERSSRRRSKSRSRSKHRSRSRQRRSMRNKTERESRSKQSHSPSKTRSKSQDENNWINESRDIEKTERPKSAMNKEVHPEYDPHEPMITSAFSDEDLRKSKEDVYDEPYSGVGGFKGFNEFESEKLLPAEIRVEPKEIGQRREKLSEGESDQEPSSTVDTSAPTVWTGCINMVDVARFYVAAHEVFGNISELEEDLSTELDIVGRINPDTVWDYISKMKRTGNKDIVILRLAAANDEEKMQYIALYSYLSSRHRLGVVKVSSTQTVKDFYILPLPAHETLPKVLALEGASLGEVRSHLLIAIIIRQRRKRSAVTKHLIPAKISRKKGLSSEDPVPTVAPSRTSSLPLPYVGPPLTTTVMDKITATNPDENEPYSPGESSSSGDTPLMPPREAHALRNKMEELNRQIEEQKQQIMRIAQADSSVAVEEPDNEAYSPSRPMTPPSVSDTTTPALADIALPSNLQEILATIKRRESTAPAPTTRRQLRSFTPQTK